MRITSMPLHLRRLLLSTSALTGFALASTAQAGQPGLPTNGTVTAGSATIAQAGANQLNITTGTSRTVIDWQSFSIASGNKVAIQQPGASSITVNEVTGGDPSKIFGDLSSNGRVVLANPNGIWFGPDSHVDVAGLVASTATLSADAKKAFASGGRLSLNVAGKSTASIVNDGQMTIAGAGLAALVAPGVRNNGVIEASLGSVTLASGQTSTLDFYGDGLVSLAVTSPVQAVAIGPDGKPFKATIENNGKLAAQHVLVTADVVKGVVDNSINMSGVVEAKGVTVSGGDIVLDGGEGDVTVAGTVDVTSQQAKGGSVAVTGGTVTVEATAVVNASGATGGGTVQIGGGPHGGGTLKHATTVLVKGGSAILANALSQGDGGTVSVWSDGLTTFGGSIQAKGAGTGNGGWVETSGHYLSIATGMVNASAPAGAAGTWLLDPFNLDIAAGGSSSTGSNMTTSSAGNSTVFDSDVSANVQFQNVTLQTGGTGGVITVDAGAAISWTNGNTLTLDATASGSTGGININGTITATNGTLSLKSAGTVSQTAKLTVSGLELAGTGGTFNLNTVANAVNVLAVNTGSANLNDNGLGPASLTIGNVGGSTGLSTTGNMTVTALNAGGITNTAAINVGSLTMATGTGTINIDSTLGSTGLVSITTNGIAQGTSFISATSLELLGAGGAYTLNLNNTGTLAANTGSVTLTVNGSLSIGTAGGTTGVTTTGNFVVALQGNDTFNLPNHVSIVTGGETAIFDAANSASTVSISGSITGKGIDIESDNPTGSGGIGGITIGGTAVIADTQTAVNNTTNSADLVFYSGVHSTTLNAGANVTAVAGNIAFIGDTLAFNTTGTNSVLSTPASVIYSPNATAGIFSGPQLFFSGTSNTNVSIGSGSSQGLTAPTIAFLSGAPGAGGNTGTVGSLQIGLPATVNTTSITDTISFQTPTTIYGSATPIPGGGLFVNGATTAADLMLNAYTISVTAPITASGNLTLNGNGIGVGASIMATGDVTLNGAATISVTAPITTSGNLTLNGNSISISSIVTTSTQGAALTVNGSTVDLSGSADIEASGPVTFNITQGGTFTEETGTFIDVFAQAGVTTDPSGNTTTTPIGNVFVDSVGTTGGINISISGNILADGIYLLAADHKYAVGGHIVIGDGGGLINTFNSNDPNEQRRFKSSTLADTILYAGPGGSIELGQNSFISATSTNIAMLADSFMLDAGATPSNISTQARVIVAPGSTDGKLQAATALPDPFSGTGPAPDYLINGASPGSVTVANVAVGTSSGETFTVSQTMLDTLSGALQPPEPGSPIGRLQLGLLGNSSTMTFRGAVNFAADSSFDAQNITVATGATLTNNAAAGFPGTSTFSFGVPEANSLIFTLTQNATTNPSAAIFAQGSSISSNGQVQVDSYCSVAACSVTPTTSFAGSITAGSILFSSYAVQDFGYLGDAVTIASTAVLTATATPNAADPYQGSGIGFQTGRGGSLTINGGATLNAGSGEFDLYTDALTFVGAPTLVSTSSINVDTGTAGYQAYPTNGGGAEEVPTITLGAVTASGGLALSSTALADIAIMAGSKPVTIGDEPRFDLTTLQTDLTTPVAVNVVGSVTLPSQTTINAVSFTQQVGTTITAPGSLTLNTFFPNNLPGPDDIAGGFLPPVLPSVLSPALSILAATSLVLNANLQVAGTASLGIGANGTFTQSGTLTAGTSNSGGVVVYESSTLAGGTININGTIVAPEIFLLASDHTTGNSGHITIGSGAQLFNINSFGTNDGSTQAETILYAGSGLITLADNSTIAGGVTNVALVSDALSVLPSAVVTTYGRLILAPASSDGELITDGSLAIPDPFSNGVSPNALLYQASPTDTISGIGVGSSAGGYTLTQQELSTLSGTLGTRDGSPAMSVARLQIGLGGGTNAVDIAGAVVLPTSTNIYGGSITLEANSSIVIPSNSVETFDTSGNVPAAPSSLNFGLDLNAASSNGTSFINFASNSFISTPGYVRFTSVCYSAACTAVPTATLAGSIESGEYVVYTGKNNDVVIIPSTAIITANGPSNDDGGILIQTGSISFGGELISSIGDIDLLAPVTLTGSDAFINTGGGALMFGSTLDGTIRAANSLTVQAGATGDITFTGLVGNSVNLGDVFIESGHNVTGPTDATLLANALASDTPEFIATSFTAGTVDFPLTGDFVMPGGLSVNPPTNSLVASSSSSAGTTAIGTSNDGQSNRTGSITIATTGAVNIGTLNPTNPGNDLVVFARGGDISSSTSNTSAVTGDGGTIDITGASITLAGALARGGQSRSGSVAVTTGGDGGGIFLTATAGNVTILGGFPDIGLNAAGGQSLLTSGGVGGSGGFIDVNATGSIVMLGTVKANGGDALAGVGGDGGDIILQASNITLGRAVARGGDTQATGAGSGGGAGGEVFIIASGTGNALTLDGNSSDFSGAANAVTYGTLNARSGEIGVTDLFNTDVGGTLANSGGFVAIAGDEDGGALVGQILLVNTGMAGVTPSSATLSGGANVLITASGSAAAGGGEVDIQGSIAAADNGVESLIIRAANGSVTVTGGIGSPTGNVLNSLVLGGSSVSLAGAFAANAISITGATLLTGDTTVSAATSVAFGGTIDATNDGGQSLTITTPQAGFVELDGAIGGTVALNNFTLTTGSVVGSVPSISVTGTQQINLPGALYSGNYTFDTFVNTGAMTLTGDTVLTATGGSIEIGGTLDGAHALTLNDAVGTITIDGVVGSKAALTSLTLNGSKGILLGATITTTGAQAYNGSTTLVGATTINSAGGVTFASTIDGAQSLTINAANSAVALLGAVGAKAALASLAINAGPISLGSVFTTGGQAYTGTTTFNGTYSGSSFIANGADILAGATGVTVSGGNIGFGALDGAQSLVLTDANGNVTFSGAIGAKAALASLTISAGGVVVGSVATTGAQSYGGAITVGGTYTANGFTTSGPVTMIANTSINSGKGDITFGSTVSGTFNLALASTNANVFFDGTLGTQTARLSLLSLSGINNATVLNNSSLWVHDFVATNVAGTLTFGNHSLESDDVVTIQASSVDGRVISTTSATIVADTVTGTIQGSTVSVNATGAVNATISSDVSNVSADSFAGSVSATRSANVAASGDVSANISVSGGSATVSGANVSGSVTSSGLAQISATQNVSADVTGGSVAIAAGGNVSGGVTSTAGGVSITAQNVSSNIVAQGGGSVDVTASGSITGSVQGGSVSLSAPNVNEAVFANSVSIDSPNATVTGLIGGNDASAVVNSANNVTQSVLGSTQQVASNTSGDNEQGSSDQGDDDDEKKKKKKGDANAPVYDFANQYIDNLVSGKH